MSFDAYHQWLGIPSHEQPPNYYRLLGIQLFESDPTFIENAAKRQYVHVQSFLMGAMTNLAKKILNEVSTAQICLLDPEKKAEYDQSLGSLTVSRQSPSPPPVAPMTLDAPPMLLSIEISAPPSIRIRNASFRVRY